MRKKILSTLRRIARKLKNVVLREPEHSAPPQQTKTDTTPPAEPTPQPVSSDSTSVPAPTKEEKAEEPAATTTAIEVDPIETPNPNAYKFKVNTKVADVSFSVAAADEAKENPLALALIQLDGVSSIFGVHDFVTVTKAGDCDWDTLIPQIIDAIQKNLVK